MIVRFNTVINCEVMKRRTNTACMTSWPPLCELPSAAFDLQLVNLRGTFIARDHIARTTRHL